MYISPEFHIDNRVAATFPFQYIDSLWGQVQHMKSEGWTEKVILRPYRAFHSLLSNALQHALPPFTPPPHTDECVYPIPRVVFRLFDATDIPEVRSPSNSFLKVVTSF